MKAGIILVGTELLNGGTLDTNSIYMAEELNKYGVEIEFKITVRDIKEEILKTLEYCKKNVDLIIMSGGLGPTLDDITKEAIAEFLNKKLVIDNEELEELKIKFKNVGLEVDTLNLREIEKPEGAITFKNDVGMAPAVFIDDIVAFPGVPKELYNMFPKFLKWYSIEKNMSNDSIFIKDLITFGMAESVIDREIREFFTEEGIFYEFLVKDYGILIRLQSKNSKKNNVEKIIKKIYNKIGEYIFGEDNERLESKAINYLIKNNLTISTAESCTGGMVGAKLIGVAGVSKVYQEGIISYSNNAKMLRLGVNKDTLNKYGAVSEEVAKEMLLNLKTDVAISTTGIAGPDGGTKEKPVGLVYIGIKIKNNIYIDKKIFKGDRQKIRTRATNQALFNLIKFLDKGEWNE